MNFASRLEELNKHYGTRILVSGKAPLMACGEAFPFDSLGSVTVRGRSDSVAIFSVDPNRQGSQFMNASGLSPEQVKLQARARELAAGPVANAPPRSTAPSSIRGTMSSC